MYNAFAEMLKPSGHGFAYRQAQHDTSFDLLVATYLPLQRAIGAVVNVGEDVVDLFYLLQPARVNLAV